MKAKYSIMMLALLPGLAVAAGTHGGGHGSGHEHGAANMEQHMGGHDMAQPMSGMGRPGQAAEISRTIAVDMNDDMRFTPARIEVKAGETVRFFVSNRGRLEHELVLGNLVMLQQHAEMMREMPHMDHAEPNMISLKPGQKGGLVWHFDQAGTVDFACLIPGHMEAGMKGQVSVAH
ncbi:plastocyanin/azurin family copper-binding protein [Oceanimonas sp. MB9]|uniref:cupredoxin domain-containing protein n=1 Tax=Oceanimonas sp. MB9 TaxID=2588453 RepID=UPI0013F5E40A|nr:cupredoxin family protein [Oceanimonas sp. MB9]NHI00668.1 Plastocyanin [Oceanimonas sp. MB9]